jgi:hypothetical protein
LATGCRTANEKGYSLSKDAWYWSSCGRETAMSYYLHYCFNVRSDMMFGHTRSYYHYQVVVGCRMVNSGLACMQHQNDLHPSYRAFSFARISRLYRQINNLRQTSCIFSDFENDSVLRTKRAKRWRNVLLNRSICAVCPLSFPQGRCLVTGMTA